MELKSNGDWTIGSTAEWLMVSPASGKGNATLTLVVQSNPTTQVRSAKINASTKDNSASLTVSQEGMPVIDPDEHYLNISPTELEVAYTGEGKVVIIECDEEWIVENGFDWIAFDKTEGNGNDEIVVTVSENTSFEPRCGEIKITSASNNSIFLIVTQEAMSNVHFLNVSPLTLNFGKQGGSLDVVIECDTDWLLNNDADWLSVSTNDGTGNGSVTITALPNVINESRTTILKITAEALSQTVSITQEPGDEDYWAYVTPDSLFSADVGCVMSISITSNCPWTVTKPSWITMPVISGTGDATLDMVVDVNTQNTIRIGNITIWHGLEALAEVVVVQMGIVSILTTDVTEVNFPASGGVKYFHLTANQAWQIRDTDTWFVCDPMSGTGNREILIKAGPLETSDPRESFVLIRGELGETISITVKQSR